MASEKSKTKHAWNKLRRPASEILHPVCLCHINLCTDSKVQKRPLLRPPIASPFANSSVSKIVYIKAATPFMSAVARVRSLLRQIDRRAAQSATDRPGKDRVLSAAKAGLDAAKSDFVIVMGSGRAIEKVLNIAAWFTDPDHHEGVNVKLLTSSTTTIDDMDYDYDEDPQVDQDVGLLPETQIRSISVLKAQISWR